MEETNFWFYFLVDMAWAFVCSIKWLIEYIPRLLEHAALPGAVVWVAHIFKEEIKNFISRATGVSAGGVSLEAKAQQQALDQKESVTTLKSLEEEKARLAEEIEKLKTEGKDFEQSSFKVIEDLRNQNTRLEEDLEFLRLYKKMYGTQFRLLKRMMVLPEIKMDFVVEFFNQAKQQIPALERDNPSRFFQYLIDSGLVDKVPDETFKLSDKGLRFVSNVTENKYTDQPF